MALNGILSLLLKMCPQKRGIPLHPPLLYFEMFVTGMFHAQKQRETKYVRHLPNIAQIEFMSWVGISFYTKRKKKKRNEAISIFCPSKSHPNPLNQFELCVGIFICESETPVEERQNRGEAKREFPTPKHNAASLRIIIPLLLLLLSKKCMTWMFFQCFGSGMCARLEKGEREFYKTFSSFWYGISA